MKHHTESEDQINTETTDTESSNNDTMTLRIAKPNVQTIVLGLIVLVTFFQTIQLYRLSGKISTSGVNTNGSSSVSTPTSNDSGAPGMVGGC